MNVTVAIDDSGNSIFSQEGSVDMDSLLKDLLSDNKELKSILSDKFKSILDTIKLDNKKLSASVVDGFSDLFDFKDTYKKSVQTNINKSVDKLLKNISVESANIGSNIKSLFEYKDKDKKLKSVFDKINEAAELQLSNKKGSSKKDLNSLFNTNIIGFDDVLINKFALANTESLMEKIKEFFEPYLKPLSLKQSSDGKQVNNQNTEDTVFNPEPIPVVLAGINPEVIKILNNVLDDNKTITEEPKEKDNSTKWGLFGALIGGAILAWMNRDKIKKWWDESGSVMWNELKNGIKKWWKDDGKEMWEDIKENVQTFIISPLHQWFTETVKDTEFYKTFKQWNDKPFTLKILDATGLTTDNEFTGMHKILDKFIVKKVAGFFTKMSSPFKIVGSFFSKFLGGAGEKGLEEVAEKAAPKFFGKAISKNVGAKTTEFIAKRLKFIPGIGALIGFGFGIKRMTDGDISGGLIDIASGIAGSFPLIGTAISVALDVINVGRDVKYGGPSGAAKSGFNTWWATELPKILRKIPLVSGFMNLAASIGSFSAGNWKAGLIQLMAVLPGLDVLYGVFEDTDQLNAKNQNVTVGEYVFNALSKWFTDIWDTVLNALTGATSKIKEFAIEKISDGWTSIKDGAKDFFSFGNKEEQYNNDDYKGMGIPPTPKTQTGEPIKDGKTFFGIKDINVEDSEVNYNFPTRIRLNPDQNDSFENYGNTDIFSKRGGTLENAFISLEKTMETKFSNLEKVFEEWATYLENIATNTNNTNKLLPALSTKGNNSAPLPAEQSIPQGYIRDAVYEHRMKIRALGI